MNYAPELLLIGAVASVGVLHTIVPDRWVPITLIARQRGWSKAVTARAAFQAGAGHVLSTLLIGLVVWLAGVVAAVRFGHLVETASSIALIAFGGWIAISAWRELRTSGGHGHSHSHGFGQSEEHRHHDHQNQVHGPELQRIPTGDGMLELSIFEAGVPPRFRLSGVRADAATVETLREGGARQVFGFARQGMYWESAEEIPEPHGFDVTITIEHGGHAQTYETQFSEHDHGHAHSREHEFAPADDPLYAPLRGETAVLTRHIHLHRHGRGAPHGHWHDHLPATTHPIAAGARVRAAAARTPSQNVGAHGSAPDPGLIADGGGHPGVLRCRQVWARPHCRDGAGVRDQHDRDLHAALCVLHGGIAARAVGRV
jgi:hypothetical protein